MRILRTLVAAVMTTVVIATAAPSTAFAAQESEVAAALKLSGTLVQHVAPSVADGDSAAQTVTADIPWNAVAGVTILQNGERTVVSLPDARHLGRAMRTMSGMVVYHNANKSDVVVVPTQQGVQLLTVINSASAPEDYAYPLALSGGQTVNLTHGGAVVLNADGKPIVYVPSAWAVSKGGAIPTNFATDGKSLTQHIAHKASSTKYPVVADPYITWQAINFTLWYGKQEVKSLAPQFWGNVMTAVIGLACGKVKGWLQAGCAAVIAGAWFWINQTFTDAAANDQCVWITVSYDADLDGWGRYNC